MAPISLEKANFLAFAFETLFYGVFCVQFVAALWAILKKRRELNRNLLATLVIMWTLSTAHWILDFKRANDAYVDLTRGTASLYYSDLSNPLQPTKTAIYVTLTLVGDAFMIYRCYIVWGKWYMAALPACILCGTGVAGYGATYFFSKASPGAEVFLSSLQPWVAGFIALTFTTNLVCTSRILMVQRKVAGIKITGMNTSLKTVLILVESAALYSSCVLCLLVTYVVGSNAQYTVLDIASPLIGIVFTLIILRVTLVSDTRLFTSTYNRAGGVIPGGGAAGDRIAMQPRPTVAVNISRLVESDFKSHDVEAE